MLHATVSIFNVFYIFTVSHVTVFLHIHGDTRKLRYHMYIEIASTNTPVSYGMGNHGGGCLAVWAVPLAIWTSRRRSARPI